MGTASIIDDIAAIDGCDAVPAADIEPRYMQDETGPGTGTPAGLAKPRSVQALSTLMALCHARRQPVVVQGGRTGLASGAVPRDGELIVSLERMRTTCDVNADRNVLIADAGVALATAQEAAEQAGLVFPVDIGARGSCTIGGMIATNAGGNQVLRYGMMRDSVLGLEVVLPDGQVITAMNTMLKNNAGFDIKQHFIGTEGTLGIVTRAVIRLRPRDRHVASCILAAPSGEQLIPILRTLERHAPTTMSAFETMWPSYFEAACACLGGPPPFAEKHGLYVLVEIAGEDEALEKVLETLLEDGHISDAVVASSLTQRQSFWAIRDSIGELMRALPLPEPFDISVPVDRLDAFNTQAQAAVAANWPEATYHAFGHAADCNLHVVLGMGSEEEKHAAMECLYDMVRDYGGSVSAEHGIGTLKRDFLSYSRSPEEIAVMRELKAHFDPHGILNPGRVVA